MTWVTAMCFTRGLFEVNHFDDHGSHVSLRGPGDRYDRYIAKSELHDTREAAVAYADKKRLRRIAALEKQIERLKAMEF